MPTKLKGSGGHIIAEITDEQSKKADLGVGELFLAPVGRIDENKISNYYCKKCDMDFASAPKIEFENPNEKVAEGMILEEKGQYLCTKCNSMIGEYRTFSKN
ncbi:MAG TPA: hypothetical protein ENH95_00010 [Nitrosopumilus sp.]|nr:hypothetical protein [Nitrosopumilus sp.]